MLEEIRNIKGAKKELRNFGIMLGCILSVLGAVALLRGKTSYPYFFSFGAVFIILGSLLPYVLKPIHKLWMSVALAIGWFVSRLILVVFFYLVITPIGLLARLFGKDILSLKFDKNADSYWIKREECEFNESSYDNQY